MKDEMMPQKMQKMTGIDALRSLEMIVFDELESETWLTMYGRSIDWGRLLNEKWKTRIVIVID